MLIRKGLLQVLKDEFPSVIIEEADDAASLLAKVLSVDCDLVVTAISMPGKSGLDVIH